jgi:two-component system sensor histidine kinase KdpD
LISAPTRTGLGSYALAVLLTGSVTFFLWLLRDVLTLANVSVIYLLMVVVVAVREGTRPSLLAAVLSVLCFNFFFITPLYTFLVSDPREVLDLAIYLIVASVCGRLAAALRQQTDAARERVHEQDLLYRLTSALNQVMDRDGVFQALRQVLQDDMPIRDAYVLPAEQPPTPGKEPTFTVLLSAAGTIYGTLCVRSDAPLSPQQQRLINTVALQTAMALHRVDLAESAQRSKGFQEADRLKTALLHSVSHDLRTPITIIKSSAANLQNLDATLSREDRLEMVGAIENEADGLDKLVGNLLDMSRLTAGAFQLHDELNDLEEVAGDVAARAYQLSHQERIRMVFPDDLPLVRFDYGLMLQALGNVVDNALRYEPAGQMVEIRGSARDRQARIAVVNHGPTITPEDREHLMEPFHHGKDGHVGLGLAIAKGIVEAHHGTLTLEDTPGGGATFIFALPLTSKETDAHENSGR